MKAFPEIDFTGDLQSIDVPTFIMHGSDDQMVPVDDSAKLAVKLPKRGTLKIYDNYPYGMVTTHAEEVNRDILAFINA